VSPPILKEHALETRARYAADQDNDGEQQQSANDAAALNL
jgi:hypothetical protein